jgi:heptosyltransferase-2
MKILVISLAGIGDTVMATPLIHELRANFPEATIDAFVRWPGARDLLQGNPHLSRVYQKDIAQVAGPDTLRFMATLRKEKYDVSINTHPQSRVHYRFVARFIKARVRVSHEYDHSGALDRLLVNRTLPQDYGKHCIENNLALLPLFGAKAMLARPEYEIYLTDAERQWADEFITGQKLASHRRVGMHIGSGATKNLALRRWPLDRYLDLIKKLNQERPDIAVLLFGGPEEKESHAQILATTGNGKVLAPQTKDFRQAAALLQKCEVFLSVDTVLMHLAAAMKVPRQLVIETPTLNKTVEPYNQTFRLIKNPAVAGRNLEYYRYDGAGIHGTQEDLVRCMKSISVDDVFQAIIEGLG